MICCPLRESVMLIAIPGATIDKVFDTFRGAKTVIWPREIDSLWSPRVYANRFRHISNPRL